MLSTTLRRYSTQVLLGFVAAGFAFLVVELILLGHTRGSQLIAIFAAVVGVVVSLLAFVPRAAMRRVALGVFVLLALSGLYGVLEHREERGERPAQATRALASASSRVERQALESYATNPPVLSPLALSGLAALGIVTLLIAEPKPAQALSRESSGPRELGRGERVTG